MSYGVGYCFRTAKIKNELRIAFLSDLHAEPYAPYVCDVRNFAPDLVIFGGDTFDERVPLKYGLNALRESAKDFPTFYTPGNHEQKAGRKQYEKIKQLAAETGAHLLAGENAIFCVKGESILLCGVEDPLHMEKTHEKQMQAACAAVESERLSVLITHRPERMEEYADAPFDLILTGHAHGGQWRFPFLRDGFLAPDQGFFPKYTQGVHKLRHGKLLISRGLATRNTRVPRIGNAPEVCLITLLPKIVQKVETTD